MFENTTDLIKKSFIKYLDGLGLSAKSHKNYRSDLSHFVGWVILRVRTIGSYVENLTEAVPFLNRSYVHEYKNYMIDNKTAPKTINRRLSTLRHLSKFLVISQVVDYDFMEGVPNLVSNTFKNEDLHHLLSQFRSHLEAKNTAPHIIKTHLSDTREFLLWLENQMIA